MQTYGAAMLQCVFKELLVVSMVAIWGAIAASAQVSAVADVYAIGSDSLLVVAAPGVLANDEAVDSLAARLIAGPTHGDVVLRSDGSFQYTPAEGYQGRDSFTYVAQILKPVTFVVDSTATVLTLDATLKSNFFTDSDQVSSSIAGQFVIYLLPGSPPYLEIHLSEAELTFLQSMHLEFSAGLLGSLLADVAPGDMMMSMLQSGGSVPASGTAFSQPENVMQLRATAALEGTGFLSSQVPAGNQDIVVDDSVALAGDIRLDAAGEVLRLELPLEITGAFDVSSVTVTMKVSGTVFASAPREPDVESKETLVEIEVGTVGTALSETELPHDTALHPVYPNPFNPQAVVTYELRAPAEIRLSVFDVMGREVRVLADGRHSAGTHQAVLDAIGLPGGVYFVRLVSDGAIYVRRAVFTK